MLRVTARSLSGLAVKARIVKHWGKPDWWDDGTDTYERLAAQIIDAVIAAEA
jgi:esterase/lipase